MMNFKDGEVLKCANQCLKNNEPIRTFIKWWKKNANDYQVTLCLLDVALRHDI